MGLNIIIFQWFIQKSGVTFGGYWVARKTPHLTSPPRGEGKWRAFQPLARLRTRRRINAQILFLNLTRASRLGN